MNTTRNKHNSNLPLWAAAEQGLTDRVRQLLDEGCDPNAYDVKNKWNYTYFTYYPIVLAAGKGHAKVVRLLAAHPDINIATVLMAIRAALVTNNDKLKKIFLDPKYVNLKCRRNVTPLHIAAQCCDPDFLQKLLKLNADPNVISDSGETPLSIAAGLAEDGNTPSANRMIKALLEYKASPDLLVSPAESALGRSVSRDNVEAVRAILPHIRETMWYSFIERNEQYEDVYLEEPWYAWALFECIKPEYMNEDIITLLVKHGADINYRNQHGWTCLDSFAAYCYLNAEQNQFRIEEFGYMLDGFEYLLDLGAVIERIEDDYSPLDLLVEAYQNTRLDQSEQHRQIERQYQSIASQMRAMLEPEPKPEDVARPLQSP